MSQNHRASPIVFSLLAVGLFAAAWRLRVVWPSFAVQTTVAEFGAIHAPVGGTAPCAGAPARIVAMLSIVDR